MKIANTIILAVLLTAGLACGYSAKATTPPTAGTTPNISALVPNSTTTGNTLGANGLMVTGANFNSNATINWNGMALSTTFVSNSQLTATIPATDVASSGTAAVNVTNPGTTGGLYGGGTAAETSNSMTFTIN
jgi:hypothetical protein